MKRQHTGLLLALTVSLVACGTQGSQTPAANAGPPALLQTQAVAAKSPSRLRTPDGRARVASFATYYRVPDAATLTRLSKKDFSIVQPDISADQMHALQNLGYAAVYLAIGELGSSNTYYEGGVAKTGRTIYDAHKNDSPKWFLGRNGNFDAWLLNLTNPAVRAFVTQQADGLLDRGFDGLFLDTADDAEFFSNADAAGPTGAAYIEGAISLDAGRPDYPTMRRAYIDTVKALRAQFGNTLLVQNGGFDLLLDRQNGQEGTQGYVDAVMHETATTRPNKPAGADDTVWPFQPQNYETWEQFYARNPSAQQAALDRAYRANRDALALEYFRAGGVIFQQDFGHPDNFTVQCTSYLYARDLRAREKKDGWIAAFSDAAFNRVYDYVETSAQVRSAPGCANYDKVTAPDFDTTFSPPTLNAGVGRSAQTTLQIAAVNGYNGAVSLRLGTLPTGVSATLSQNSVTPGPQTRVTLTVTLASSVGAGTVVVPVKAQSGGQSMAYDLRLTAWNTSGDSVFIAQAGLNKVIAYDNSASLTATAASRGLANGSLRQPLGIVLDAQGTQYVAENVATPGSAQAGRIVRYPSYSLNSGAETTEVGSLSYPTALALDTQNRLWVVESGLNNLPASSGDARFETPGQLSRFDSLPDGKRSQTRAATIPVPRSSYGVPLYLAIQGDSLWVTTSYGLLLRYDVAGTPTLNGVYTVASRLDEIGGVTAQGGVLWLSGKKAGVSAAVRLDVTALPGPNSIYAVDGSAAVTQSVTSGLYDPAGLAFDRLGNLWVVNKTGAAGVAGTDANDPGTLVRYPAAQLAAASPAPDLRMPLGSRYPVGLAVGRP